MSTHPLPSVSLNRTPQAFLSDFLKEFASTPEAFSLLYRTRVLIISPQVILTPLKMYPRFWRQITWNLCTIFVFAAVKGLETPKAGCGRASSRTNDLRYTMIRMCPCHGFRCLKRLAEPVLVSRRAVVVVVAVEDAALTAAETVAVNSWVRK